MGGWGVVWNPPTPTPHPPVVPSCENRSLAKFLHCVHTAHAKAEILTQEYLSPI